MKNPLDSLWGTVIDLDGTALRVVDLGETGRTDARV